MIKKFKIGTFFYHLITTIYTQFSLIQKTGGSGSGNIVKYHSGKKSFLMNKKTSITITQYTPETLNFISSKTVAKNEQFSIAEYGTSRFVIGMHKGSYGYYNLDGTDKYETWGGNDKIQSVVHFSGNFYIFGRDNGEYNKYDASLSSLVATRASGAGEIAIIHLEKMQGSSSVVGGFSDQNNKYDVIDGSLNEMTTLATPNGQLIAALSPSFTTTFYYIVKADFQLTKIRVSNNGPETSKTYGNTQSKSLVEIKGMDWIMLYNAGHNKVMGYDESLATKFDVTGDPDITGDDVWFDIDGIGPYIGLTGSGLTDFHRLYSLQELCHSSCGTLCTIRNSRSATGCNEQI